MIRRLFVTAVILSITIVGCTHKQNPTGSQVRELTSLEKELVESDNRFGLKLFREINNAEAHKNLFISPLSVSMALGMTLNGASGETQAAMEQTLELAGFSTQEINESYQSLSELLTQLDPRVVFEIANSIWYRDGWAFEPAFIEANQTYFDAVVQALNFNDPQSVHVVNGWVNDKTHGKIEEIIHALGPDLVMLLINAIYFKGTWAYEFDKDFTLDDQFQLPGGGTKACKMMLQTNEFDYQENEEFHAIDLPYGDGQFSMTIFLPTSERSVDDLIANFNNENWNSWLAHFSKDSVTLQMPKFKLEYEITLNQVLTDLGMGVAFTPIAADFSRMHQFADLYISFVKHKTFIEVDEEGTEAAAVTVVGMETTSGGSGRDIKFMRVDRPFVFVIREHHSDVILFIGKVVEPES
jgi:serpin B